MSKYVLQKGHLEAEVLVLTVLLLLGSVSVTFAQGTITGNITDAETGAIHCGASVLAVGRNICTTTNVDGDFTFSLPLASIIFREVM